MLPVTPFSMPERPLSESDKIQFMKMKSILTSLRHRRKVNHRSSLNGSHGEFTDTDDVKKGQGPMHPGRRNSNKQNPQTQKKKKQQQIVARSRSRPNPPLSSLAGGGPGGQITLSKCAAKFLLAQTDPFSKDAVGACIPIQGSRNSLRYTGIARGTVSTGTGGAGWFSLHPTVSNTGVLTIATTASNAASSSTKPTILTANDTLSVGYGTHFMGTIPYTNGMFTTGLTQNTQLVMGRIVGGGLRIRCIGAPLYRQGVNYVSCSPTHENYSQMMSFGGSGTGTSGSYTRAYLPDEEIFIPFGPSCEEECQYIGSKETPTPSNLAIYPLSHGDTVLTSTGYTYANDSINTGAAFITVWFTGAMAANPVAYEWEVVQHIEYAGLTADTLGIPVESDTVGVQRVQSAISQVFSASLSAPHGSTGKPKSMTRIAIDMLKQTASEAAPVVLSSLARSLPALLL